MGLPVGRLICASNENKVLFDFFQTGSYDRNRDFILTSSPSMDILISSNLERLIYRIAGEDDRADAAFMKNLAEKGVYEITPAMREKLGDFYGNFATEQETAQTIQSLYDRTGYVIDSSHGCGFLCVRKVQGRYRRQGKGRDCLYGESL